LDAFSNQRTAGIIALTADLDDHVISAKLSDGKCDIFIATREGMSIRFNEDDVRPMGRAARGVKAIALSENDIVMSLDIIEKGCVDTILMVTEMGYGKKSSVDEYRVQGRAGVGIITQKTTDKVGLVVGAQIVRPNQEVILTTDKGQVIRMRNSDISTLGRNTQGVRLINLDDKDEKVTGFTLVTEDEPDKIALH
jgi:DNA gyrase subunit A